MSLKTKVAIVDIDGTVADPTHRRHFVEGNEPKDWAAFFRPDLILKDEPRPTVIAAVQDICARLRFPPVFVTGRNEKTREATVEWLRANLGWRHFKLFMRADDDFRPDYEVKHEIYLSEIEPVYEVVVVFDDRTSVVKMWRGLGLECWQVANGDF